MNIIAKLSPFQSRKSIMKTCQKICDDLSVILKENEGKIQTEDLQRTIKKYLRNPDKTLIAGDAVTAEKFMQEIGTLPQETISQLKNYCGGIVIHNPKTDVSLYYVGLDKLKSKEALNAAVHESQHLLNKRHSFTGKFQRAAIKFIPKWRMKQLEKKVPEIQQKYLDLQHSLFNKFNIYNPAGTERFTQEVSQNGLLERFNRFVFSNKKSMEEMKNTVSETIRSNMLYNDSKNKIYNMRAIRAMYKDEARSYRAGGNAVSRFENQTNGSNNSEMAAELMDLTVKQLKKAIRNERINKIKRLFKHTPKPKIEEVTTTSENGIVVTLRSTKRDIK